MEKKFIFFICCVLAFLHVNGQTNPPYLTTLTTGNPATVCGDEFDITIEVKNTSPTETLTNIRVSSKLPAGVNFVSGSTVFGGTYAPGSPEDLNNPIFGIADLASGATQTLIFKAKAGCEVIAVLENDLVKNATVAMYNKSSDGSSYTYYEPNGSQSYGVRYPALQVLIDPADKTQNATNRETKARRVTIRNGGTGAVQSTNGIKIYIDYLDGLEFQGAVCDADNNLDITPNGASTEILINDFTGIGNGNDLFEQNEELVLTETVRIMNCGSSTQNTDFTVRWGCNGQVCNNPGGNATATASVQVISGRPNFTVTENTHTGLNYCGGYDLEFTFYNQGNGTGYEAADKATDVKLKFAGTFYNNATVTSFSNFRIRQADGTFAPVADKGINVDPQGSNWTLSFSGIDPDGAGGMSSLDDDQTYDDLAKGQSVVIRTTTQVNCPAFFNDDDLSYDFDLYNVSLSYQNACFNLPFEIPPAVIVNTHNTNNFQNISGPLDLLPDATGEYLFSVNRDYYAPVSGMNCPSSAFYSDIVLPPGYSVTGDIVWETSDGGTPAVVPYTRDGNIWHIDGGGWKGTYRINVALTCEGEQPAQPISTIGWDMYYQCGPCSCAEHIVHSEYEVFNHCPNCPGFHTQSFKVERTTLGWPEPSSGYYTDNTLASTSKVSATTPGIRLGAALENDVVHAEAKGKLTFGTYDNAHVEIRYTSPVAANVLGYVGGYFMVNGSRYDLPSGIQAVDAGNNIFTFDFQVPANSSSCPTCPTSFQAGDQIDLYVDFEVLRLKDFPFGEHGLYRFRAEHFGWDNTVRNACESFGAGLSIIKMKYARQGMGNARYLRGCSEESSNALLAMNNPQGFPGYDPFPNEFRPLTTINEIVMDIPAGFAVVPGKSRIGVESAQGGVDYYLEAPQMLSGDKARWSRTANWPIADINFSDANLSVAVKIYPECRHSIADNTNVYVNYTLLNYFYTGSFAEPAVYAPTVLGVWNELANERPNLELSGGTTLDAVTRDLIWPVYLSNLAENSITDAAENTWLTFIPPSSNIELIGVTAPPGLPAPILADYPGHPERKFVRLGTIPAGANSLRYELKIRYKNCTKDAVETVTLKARSSCNGYPAGTDVTCASPERSIDLNIRYKTADLRFEVFPQVDRPKLCEDIPYILKFTSPFEPDMNEIKLLLTLPSGVEVNPSTVQYEYPSGSGTWTAMAGPQTIDGKTGWDLSALLPAMNPLVGTHVQSPPLANELRIKIDLRTMCGGTGTSGFDFGGLVVFNATGVTNCNNDISKKDQRKIILEGVDLDSLSLNVQVGDFATCASSVPFDIVLNNLGSNPTASDMLEVTLPAGVTFGGMVEGSGPASTTVNADGTTLLLWNITPIAPGSALHLKFNVVTSADAVQGPVTAKVHASMPAQVVCATTGETCNLRGTTASANLERNIGTNPQKPEIALITKCPDKPLIAGQSAGFAILNPVEGAVYEWDFDNDNYPDVITSALTASYTFMAPGLYPVKVTMRTGSCRATSDIIYVEVIEVALVIPEFCPNEVVEAVVSPSNLPDDDYIWFKDGVLLEVTGPKIQVSAPGLYRVVIRSLSCVQNEDQLYSTAQLPEGYYLATAGDAAAYRKDCDPPCPCIGGFMPEPGKKYLLSAWVKQEAANFVERFDQPAIKLEFQIQTATGRTMDNSLPEFRTTQGTPIVGGWQRIEADFIPPTGTVGVTIKLLSGPDNNVYYDDIRIHPYDGVMKSFVYDFRNLRLMSVLDENNYASFYEYDHEGKLVHIKKETERGIVTIQESLNNIYKKP